MLSFLFEELVDSTRLNWFKVRVCSVRQHASWLHNSAYGCSLTAINMMSVHTLKELVSLAKSSKPSNPEPCLHTDDVTQH
jgi:hypothetical protein